MLSKEGGDGECIPDTYFCGRVGVEDGGGELES